MSSADATIEMERKIPSKKKRGSLWELRKFHQPFDKELARKFPAHIGGAKTSILPALPKKEKWQAKWPEDFESSKYTFGYTSEYPTPSDKQIIREVQLRKFAEQLAKRLEYMPKDMVMRHAQEKGYIADFARALGDRSGYSLGHLAYPEGFRHLPLPRDKRHKPYHDMHKQGERKLARRR